MARAIWKGVISFEDVTVPVKLYSAVQDRSIHFHLLHDQDMVRIRQRMVNPETEQEVPREQMRRGTPTGDGQFVILDDEELDQLEPEPSREIRIERFVEPAQIADIWYDRPYYLGPDEGVENDYWALAAALQRQNKEGVARWVMRKREYAGALRIQHGYLMLIALRFEDQVIPASSLQPPQGRQLDKKELKMAEQLIGALEERFDPTDYHNEYRERVKNLIKTKAAGGKVEFEPFDEKKAVSERSLAEMLEASLSGAKKG